jgi:hypothetical protein
MYQIWRDGTLVDTPQPARYAGISTMKIFGRLTCGSGRRALPKNRIFFANWEDAIQAGYRPCLLCKPTPNDTYERGADGAWCLIASPDASPPMGDHHPPSDHLPLG